MFNKFLNKNSDYFYFVFRVLIGLLFLLHGIMKWQGIASGTTPMTSLIWYAGIIEIIAGVLFILGLFVRPAAFITSIEMLVAFFKVHVGSTGILNPLVNKGEPAVLFFLAFLVILSQGARKWSLDNVFFKK